MIYKKNDLISITIDDIGNDGEGIGHIDGYTFFIKDALPGEKVQAKVMKANKNYGFARVMTYETISDARVEPPCPNARRCGGCNLMHLAYEQQLIYKENKVKNCLSRIGGYDMDYIDAIMEPIMGMDEPYRYRNKASFPVASDKEGNVVTGFFAQRSHNIIEMEDCLIQDSISCKVAMIVKDWMKKYNIRPYNEVTGSGIVRHIVTRVGYYTGQIMVCLVVTKTKIFRIESLVKSLTEIDGMTSISLNVNKEKTNRIMGDKMVSLYGPLYVEDKIGELSFRISPLSFFQVNPVQTVKLYGKALEYAGLTGNETVWDLYCGIGTISLFLAKQAGKVLGVEIVPEAIMDAKVNAQINDIENAHFITGAAEDVAAKVVVDEDMKEFANPDIIVVDPPRKGCDETLIDTILKVGPKKVVYVSCDPATLARDVKRLAGGYEVKKVCACDMFGMGGHVETVCLLSKKP